MVNVDPKFHTLIASDNPQTRIRVYFISDTVDCTDDEDVETNGYLLISDLSQTDSNTMIGQAGIEIDEYFNKDRNITIGETVSSTFSTTFLNWNGILNDFQFGRCKIYLDVFDSDDSAWLPCPRGVYIIDMPTKRKVQLVSVTAYDQMQLLDQIADNWWNALDFGSGLTLRDIFESLASAVGVRTNYPGARVGDAIIPVVIEDPMINGETYTYTSRPFVSVERTYRDILNWIAEAACGIAKFDRNGYLKIEFFSPVSYNVDADTMPTNVLAYDQAEYSVAVIDALQVSASSTDIGVVVGTGSNAYRMVDNGFMLGSSDADIRPRATNIYNALNGLGSYRPLNLTLIGDPSVESGDIVSFTLDLESFDVPIFQQRITWRGGFVSVTMWNSGDPERPALSASNRYEFRSNKTVHELEVTVDQLRSLIQDMEGNYTLIQQTVDSIQQVVSAQGITISDILDPTGEIWTAITTNSSNLSDIETALNNEVAERKSYIRFIPAEPAIVLGVDTGNEIKLKLNNGIIYFFNGQDDSTDLSLAYAWFNSNEMYATTIVAGKSVQFGEASDTIHWIWKKLDNDDLVLDMLS